MKKIQLSDHFTYRKLARFTLSPIIMMVFTSIYSVVDGMFVANCVGSNALASINIVVPLIYSVGAVGFMVGTGGSAEVARALGEGKSHRAKQYFTTLVLALVALGIILSAVSIFFLRPICYLLGASSILIDDCITYGRIMLFGQTFFMLQTSFQTFFVTAERPKYGLFFTIAAGLLNIILDFVFVKVLALGVAGAAWATITGFIFGGVVPLLYFAVPNHSLLRFVKTELFPKMLLHSCGNGASEMVSGLSSSLVTFLFNLQMMRLVGEDGVAAISIVMYVNFFFIAIFIGFSIGTAPVIGYHFGAENREELHSLFRKGMRIILMAELLMFALSESLAYPLTLIYAGRSGALHDMTLQAFRIFSFTYLGAGLTIFGSSMFTALCNGRISAGISFLRALILPSVMIFLLPVFIGLPGVWLAIPAAELITAGVTIVLMAKNRERYGY